MATNVYCLGLTLTALAAFLVAFRGAAQEEGEELGFFDAGMAWIEENVSDEVLELFEIPTEEDWDAFWQEVADVLSGESLEDLSWMRPGVEAAVEILRYLPGGEGYADWLEQRLDYFDVAEEIVEERRVTPRSVVRRPPPPARRRIVLLPSVRPPPPPPPSVEARERSVAGSRAVWTRKLSGRSPPSRADELVPRLKQIFRSEGVPPELVWVAEVESSMNPRARSPAGAAGLFQLVPATARRFGLKTGLTDERLDAEKNARAAAKYLRYLYGKFHSWPLALAAYNAGEGRIGKLLKKVGAGSFEGIQLSLPVETQMYVPKVMALVSLREGRDVVALPAPGG